MKHFYLITLLVLTLFVESNAMHPEAVNSYRATIAQALDNPNQENIAVLGKTLLSSSAYLDESDSVAVTIHKEIKTALLAIPGHAEYYRDRLLQAQERYKKQGGNEAWLAYRKEMARAFDIFPHLVSPEGVRVLGELMSNEWVPPGNDDAPASEKFSNFSESATVALSKLPIMDKPFKEMVMMSNAPEAVAAWRQWHEEIKSGKRTFRFEGDPTEYDLRGPAPGQKLSRISRDQKHAPKEPSGRESTPISSAVSPPSETPTVEISIACLMLLVSLAWYFARMRRRKVS